MIAYAISGRFYPGMTWEDFISTDKGRPSATIEASPGVGDVEIAFAKSKDGFYDALVSPALTRESAKVVLAAINGVTADMIVIREDGTCLAV